MRTSSYTIYADLPDSADEVLLVHGYTGAVERVGRAVAEYLRWAESGKPPKPLYGVWRPDPRPTAPPMVPDDATIAQLRARGFLTTRSHDEEVQLFSKIATSIHEAAKRKPTWLFMPTYDCNLRCGYCFQDHMRTNASYAHLLRRMTPELVARIFTAIGELAARHGMDPARACDTSVTLYGGEPLLADNRPIVLDVIERATRLGGRGVFVVSNATELHAYADVLGSGGITGLQITLDGPPDEHDLRRIRADGSGTFSTIADNIDLALAKGVAVSVRMNIDRDNIPTLPRLADEIVRRGWDRNPMFVAYTAVIVLDRHHTGRDRTLSSWEATRELERLAVDHPQLAAITAPTGLRRRDLVEVLTGRRSIKTMLRSTYCGAHTADYMFDPLGDIYACWERTGDARLRIGHIDETGRPVLKENGREQRVDEDRDARRRRLLPIVDAEPADETTWRSRNVTTNSHCRQCRYALFCGGGCAAYALNTKAEYYANYCDGFQNTFRADVAAAYRTATSPALTDEAAGA